MTNLPAIIPPHRAGRRPTCTPEFIDAVTADIRGGMTLSTAARRHGASDRTLRRWIAEGRDYDERIEAGLPVDPDLFWKWRLHLGVDAALAAAEAALTQIVVKAAVTDPKLALAVLGRRNPAEWADPSRSRVRSPYDDDDTAEPELPTLRPVPALNTDDADRLRQAMIDSGLLPGPDEDDETVDDAEIIPDL